MPKDRDSVDPDLRIFTKGAIVNGLWETGLSPNAGDGTQWLGRMVHNLFQLIKKAIQNIRSIFLRCSCRPVA